MTSSSAAWDAIVLAGGRAERLGGTEKPGLMIGSRTLLERTISAVSRAERIVIAGDAVADGCITAVEPVPFGGPVSGIAAALPHTTAERVLVAACDHPFIDAAVPLLTGADAGRDSVVGVDPTGRRQYLLACLRRPALAAALAALDSPHGISMRHLLATLDLREIVVDDRAAFDVDTWDDVARGRELDESEVADHD